MLGVLVGDFQIDPVCVLGALVGDFRLNPVCFGSTCRRLSIKPCVFWEYLQETFD